MGQQEMSELWQKLRSANEDFFRGNVEGPLNLQYDKVGDVVYIALGDPQPAVTWRVLDGLMLRYDPDTMKIVGFTITAFRQYFLLRYPEFCFLSDILETPKHVQKATPHPRQEAYQVAALCRTTSALMLQYAAV